MKNYKSNNQSTFARVLGWIIAIGLILIATVLLFSLGVWLIMWLWLQIGWI